MRMTPEEVFNRQVWETLQDIQEEILATVTGNPVKYTFSETIDAKVPPARRRKILNKLEEKEAFKIHRNSKGTRIGTGNTFYLIINPQKFDEVYKEYQKACDLNTYLNDYQQKVFKGEKKLPEFSQIESTKDKKAQKILAKQRSELALRPTAITAKTIGELTDSRQEQYYEEEINLISKLLQICSPVTKSIELIRPTYIADSDPDRAGFDNIETLKDLEKVYEVLSNFEPSLHLLTKSRTGIVKADVNYQKLLERAERLHDETESWKGTVYGIEEQKKRILVKLQDYIKKSPHQNQEPYIYSERILGIYTPKNDNQPMGASLSNPDPNRPDIKFQFMRAMRGLEKDGHIEILGVEFDFNDKPKATSESSEACKWSFGERSLEFYPARHCHVTLRPKTSISTIEKKIEKDVDIKISSAQTSSESQSTEWPETFKWSANEDSYEVGDGKAFNFGAKISKRKDILKILTDKKGCWCTVQDIGKSIGKSDNYVRVTISQLNKRIVGQGLKRYLTIEWRKERDKPGACHVVSFPSDA